MITNRFIQAGIFAMLLVVLGPYNLKAECKLFLYEPFVLSNNTLRLGDVLVPPVDNVIQGCISKNKLANLLNVTVFYLKASDSRVYYFLSGEDGKRIRTKNCNEYIAAKKKGMTPKTEYDEAVELNFINTCGALNALLNSGTFKHDYIGSKNNLSPKSLPVIFLTAPTGIEYEKLAAECKNEVSFEDYLKGELFKLTENVKDNPEMTYLGTWYGDSEEDGNGFWLELQIIAKSDFNKDGYSDYLVHYLKGINRGLWFDSGFVLLSSKDNSNKLYNVYGNDFVCAYQDKDYVCSDPSKGKPASAWSAIE